MIDRNRTDYNPLIRTGVSKVSEIKTKGWIIILTFLCCSSVQFAVAHEVETGSNAQSHEFSHSNDDNNGYLRSESGRQMFEWFGEQPLDGDVPDWFRNAYSIFKNEPKTSQKGSYEIWSTTHTTSVSDPNTARPKTTVSPHMADEVTNPFVNDVVGETIADEMSVYEDSASESTADEMASPEETINEIKVDDDSVENEDTEHKTFDEMIDDETNVDDTNSETMKQALTSEEFSTAPIDNEVLEYRHLDRSAFDLPIMVDFSGYGRRVARIRRSINDTKTSRTIMHYLQNVRNNLYNDYAAYTHTPITTTTERSLLERIAERLNQLNPFRRVPESKDPSTQCNTKIITLLRARNCVSCEATGSCVNYNDKCCRVTSLLPFPRRTKCCVTPENLNILK